ncbi:protein of unknown function (plasmid) [Paraburkholderia kururiensis]
MLCHRATPPANVTNVSNEVDKPPFDPLSRMTLAGRKRAESPAGRIGAIQVLPVKEDARSSGASFGYQTDFSLSAAALFHFLWHTTIRSAILQPLAQLVCLSHHDR